MQLNHVSGLIKASKKQLKANPSVLLFNGLMLLLLVALSIYAKVADKGQGLEALFEKPFDEFRPYLGALSSFSKILWCFTATTCMFSFRLLKSNYPHRKGNTFILYSGVLILVLLVDDTFRLTTMLSFFLGIPKIVKHLLYGIAAIALGRFFWQKLLSTPYVLLLLTGVLFVLSGIVDLLGIPGSGLPAMLEEGTMLLGILNLALYFWHICQQEILQTLRRSSYH